MSTIAQYSGRTLLFTSGQTIYLPISGSYGAQTTESVTQIPWRTAGTLSFLGCRISANATTGGSTTFKSRIGGADGGISVSITTGTTGFYLDSSGTSSITAGNLVNYQFINGTGGNTTISSLVILFAASSGTATRFVSGSPFGALSSASTTTYHALCSKTAENTTETFLTCTMRGAGTLSNGFASIGTNARGTDSTFRTRIGGSDGNIAISITASTTGVFEDTSNTDSISVGNLVNYSITTGTGSGNLVGLWGSDFIPSGTLYPIVGGSTAGIVVNASAVNYVAFGGDNTMIATELNVRTDVDFATTFSNLFIQISANTIVGAGTVVLRVEGSTVGNSASITGLTTGYFEDVTDSDTVSTTTNDVNYLVTGGAAGTSMTVNLIGIHASFTSSSNKTILPPPLNLTITLVPSNKSVAFNPSTLNLVSSLISSSKEVKNLASALASAFSLQTSNRIINATLNPLQATMALPNAIPLVINVPGSQPLTLLLNPVSFNGAVNTTVVVSPLLITASVIGVTFTISSNVSVVPLTLNMSLNSVTKIIAFNPNSQSLLSSVISVKPLVIFSPNPITAQFVLNNISIASVFSTTVIVSPLTILMSVGGGSFSQIFRRLRIFTNDKQPKKTTRINVHKNQTHAGL